MPGFFEGGNLDFPLGNEYDKAYKTINHATYKFHHLDDNLRYANQENYFKLYGEYEPLEY